MCGICGTLVRHPKYFNVLRKEFCESACSIQHRGPDRSTSIVLSNPINAMIDFERLAIMDTSTIGDQPFKYETDSNTVYTICNGEIYNFHEIIEAEGFCPVSGSDCEVIPLLYQKYGLDGMHKILNMFNSEHAFAILDINRQTGDYKLILTSDRFGIRPIFVGWDEMGFYFGSELQSMPNHPNIYVERFKPRHFGVVEFKDGVLQDMVYHEYYSVRPSKIEHYDLEFCKSEIKRRLEEAVISRLESDRPYGSLLSGGLDSSLVSAIAARHLKKNGQVLRTFSIGMPGGTDEVYAKMVAEHIGSIHTHIEKSEQEFLDAIPDVVKAIGSLDITTIRASTGQYLVSKWVAENTDIKVLALGDLSDEGFCSYLYGSQYRTYDDFHNECIRLLEDVHMYDGLRADRCVSHFGIEARFPFSDHRLFDFVLRCDIKLRVAQDGMEKWLLRESFVGTDLLPEKVLWRSKTALSDGVSCTERSWYVVIQEYVETFITDQELADAQTQYSHLTPHSKESLYYRRLFCEYFGTNESVAKTIPYFWLPKWCGDIKEPSARILPMCKD